MANFLTANLVKAQAIMTRAFNQGELRYRIPATFLEFLKNTDIMLPSYRELRTREDRVVEANYFARQARALGSARSHTHPGVRGDSAVLTPTWNTFEDRFKMSLKQADNSVYDIDQEIAYEYQNVIANFAEGLEVAATNYLFNNRSGVNTYAAQGTFNATQDAFEIAEANENRGVQIAKSAMDFNKYQGMGYTFFCDTVAYDKFEYSANQGTGNSANLSFQYSNVTFVKSVDLDSLAGGLVAPYTKGFWIAVPNGMIAALDWIPIQNRVGVETKENSYSSIINPVDSLAYAQHMYEERADETATNGYSQDLVKEIQISTDIAFEHAPITTADTTPLQAFAIV